MGDGCAMSNFIKLMSSDESIDLSILSVDDLYKLHFTEESFIANKAKKMPPFSIERNKFLQAGYEIVLAIMAEARSRKRQKNKNNGVTDYSVAVLLDLIGKKLESQITNFPIQLIYPCLLTLPLVFASIPSLTTTSTFAGTTIAFPLVPIKVVSALIA